MGRREGLGIVCDRETYAGGGCGEREPGSDESWLVLGAVGRGGGLRPASCAGGRGGLVGRRGLEPGSCGG